MFSLFSSLFTLVFIAAIAVFFLVFFRSLFRVSRFSSRVFDHVERELDRRDDFKATAEPARCGYCGSRVKAKDKCPNCGAPVHTT